MKVKYENKYQKVVQFNLHYGAKVTVEFDDFDPKLKDYKVQLIEMNRAGFNRLYEPIGEARLCPMGETEVEEVLLYLETLVNTKRLRQALKEMGDIDYFSLIEFNGKERVEYKPKNERK